MAIMNEDCKCFGCSNKQVQQEEEPFWVYGLGYVSRSFLREMALIRRALAPRRSGKAYNPTYHPGSRAPNK